MAHKAGFVNILGNPNVGKSTLMNAMVGERISIITSKSQTTRHRIMGIVNTDDYQIVYSDTPGMLKPNYKLQESMRRFSMSALDDADIILFVTDVVEEVGKNADFIEKVNRSSAHCILLINKIDLTDGPKLDALTETWHQMMPKAEILPVAALRNFNLDVLLKRIVQLLPENEPYFPKDELTDRSTRFFVTEIIREKILLQYDKEIPYSVEIEIEEYKEYADIVHISAVIHVSRDSQKAIIIGHKGIAIKWVGIEARKDIESFIGKKVFLKTFVTVTKDWRDRERSLREFGYE